MIKVDVFTFNPFQENTYVLSNETGEAIIIDPGCYFSAEWDELKNALEANNLRVTQLLFTHCHLDHVFGSKWVAQHYQLVPGLHKEEEIIMTTASEVGARYGLTFDNYTGPFRFIQEGDTVTLGEDTLSVLFTPGHSPGSICFYDAQEGFVIGGDVLFKDSVGRTDLPGGSHEQLLSSIRTKLFPLPDNTIVYPGHGGPTTIGYEKKNNPFLS
ncbi:Glyoxylase, beta-lactamase superfamily II [Filimonas lacunae]|uniref:Glyoxylase, beta-lactamase superfamily II n=1 Tax=Filimonas lacunae TaxID=477680 RepID=A0A173MP56_9BACT|nr:MBL fold metallo-hydrolase [Filimonas lacunae]BAV09249.1 hydroxyacylglutathione hydrolase [Filimonas lacunae]SIS69765.1 Glyoxylase, beta-lactamase superfamily II [Filimonas lacunae]